jgi:hypothetical protein
MIMIVDDYILLLASFAAIIWGFVRYLLAPRVSLPAGEGKQRSWAAWAIESAVVLLIGAGVLIVTARVGTENTISDIVAWAAAAIFALAAFFLPRGGYRPELVKLDRIILIILAVLLLAGSLYDNIAG